MERLTKKKNGCVVIPDVPTPFPRFLGSKQYKRDYMNFARQNAAMIEKLAAYEDKTEVQCEPLDYILSMAHFPYYHLKEVPREEWEQLDYAMQTFDEENADYNLKAMPLLALILRELLSTPFTRERRDIMCRYVPSFVSGPRWDKLLDEYWLGDVKHRDIYVKSYKNIQKMRERDYKTSNVK